MKKLDLIALGRSCVDLCGSQRGGRIEDMRSFDKYIAGSPTNITVGAARLGVHSALITRVSDDHLGRFIHETLQSEGVNTDRVVVDQAHFSALVVAGVQDTEHSAVTYCGNDCADLALCEDDIDPQFIASARVFCMTGLHLLHPKVAAASANAVTLARDHGLKTVLHIDYSLNLWGLAKGGDAEGSEDARQALADRLQSMMGQFDLITGSEEAFQFAAQTSDTILALQKLRTLTSAVFVCQRGSIGGVAFNGEASDWSDGITGQSFDVEVSNRVGGSDAFVAGLLKGWLEDSTWAQSLTYANACAALALSRHGGARAYPSLAELEFFLERGLQNPVLAKDSDLAQIHWSTNRKGEWRDMHVFAFDHRSQIEEIADAYNASHDLIGAFKKLCLEAAQNVAQGRNGYGILCDGRLGSDALYAAAGTGLWIGRPTELPGSRPLDVEPELGPDCGGLQDWASNHVVKLLCFYHPHDSEEIKAQQEAMVQRVFSAARRNRLEFLLEVIPSKVDAVDDSTTAQVIERFYDIGVYPDWWKLEPLTSAKAWVLAVKAIQTRDPHTRGIVVLGLDAPEEELAASFAIAAQQPLVKGFAVGRTIFAQVARDWFAGQCGNEEAVATMTSNFSNLCKTWDNARAQAQAST